MGSKENLSLQENYQPRVRYVGSLTIYFHSKQSIYVTDGKVAIVVERWFDGKGIYKRWRNLVWAFSYGNVKSVYHAWEIARHHDLQVHQSFSMPRIDKDVKVMKKESK